MDKYKLTKHNCIIRLVDGACIPVDPGNTDYVDYLEWIAAGGEPLIADEQGEGVPESVTMLQARLALLAAGKLSVVNAAIGAMPGVQGEKARIEWGYAQHVQRDSPLVAAMESVLGMTGAEIDALFIAADKL